MQFIILPLSTLYIHFPCKAIAEFAPSWQNLPYLFALVSDDGKVEREATSSLAELSATIAKAQRVVVMLAASDVTLLQVSLPPLSASKLKAVLPNLVEDQLLGNAADCVVVSGEVVNGLRTVAVVQRAWLERVNKTLIALGAKHISVLPAQLCLPHQANRVVAAIAQHDSNIDLTLRLTEQIGMGLALLANQPPTLLETLCAVVPEASITLHVPQASVSSYQAALNHTELKNRITITADNASVWISGARHVTLNLLTGLNAESGVKIDWRPWRWPLILASVILISNIVALNFDWWQLKSEAKNLRTSMTQIYQARFPKETVVIDPVAQMQQKIAFAKRDAGLATPHDFTALAAAFGSAWDSVTSNDKPTVTSLEYRENGLIVNFKANQNGSDEALVQQVRDALESHHFSLDVVSSDSSVASWEIRSAP